MANFTESIKLCGRYHKNILAYFLMGHHNAILRKHDFQVQQCRRETQLKCGGEHSHYFVANSLRTLCTKLHQNQPNFTEDTTKTFGLLFSGSQCILHILCQDRK